MPKVLSTLAAGAVATLGLFVSTSVSVGTLGECVRSMPTASAAPSPTCGGDLRECLRHWADLRQTPLGGRYVTAHDVALCMEIFNNCIHGGASSGGGGPNPSVSTPSAGGGGTRKTMPQRFRIEGEDFDCTVSGNTVDCTAPPTDTTTKAINATLSGLTMTGTRTEHFVGPSVQGCVSTVDYSWPIAFVFRPDGTGDLHMSQGHYDQTLSGSCSGEFSEPVDGADGPIKWSPIQ